MAKNSISYNYKISAKGILYIEDDVVGIEHAETGELIQLSDLFEDFADKSVSLSISYDEEYSSVEQPQEEV